MDIGKRVLYVTFEMCSRLGFCLLLFISALAWPGHGIDRGLIRIKMNRIELNIFTFNLVLLGSTIN